MNLDDDNLDKLLGEHLHTSLGAQLGRAETVFRREPLTSPRRRSSLRMPFQIIGLFAAAAAVWAVAMLKPSQPAPVRPVPSQKSVATANPDARDLQYTAYTQTLDDGLIFLDDQTPVHQLRKQEVQQVRWLEDDGKTQMKVTIPKEQVFLVEYSKD